ncbi:MAG: flavodoxin-dependent (E)-4-hydroxy-3-methylbut-2-enyl-diphosphate synthase [Anaerobutyricum soehngenii]
MPRAHELLADRKCRYPRHVGITEAGTLVCGNIKSAIGLGIIFKSVESGDTIRRFAYRRSQVNEIASAKQILGRRSDFQVRVESRVVSCPTCGRTEY